MRAFKGAVEVGAHALETDVHLTRDQVVVLSHVRICPGLAVLNDFALTTLCVVKDASLQRCFGLNKKIVDCDWDYISGLRTLSEPHEQMPRLQDIIDYLAEPGLEDVWLLLDIKVRCSSSS